MAYKQKEFACQTWKSNIKATVNLESGNDPLSGIWTPCFFCVFTGQINLQLIGTLFVTAANLSNAYPIIVRLPQMTFLKKEN